MFSSSAPGGSFQKLVCGGHWPVAVTSPAVRPMGGRAPLPGRSPSCLAFVRAVCRWLSLAPHPSFLSPAF
ncbi:unnamed protein product [Danaus chrysippus]|uniref:(African queen) hypothetical protein n=1 Tax=Danaus chrysippus TaxID=151541 RepID=A0A8J2W9P7_9NEOP|nr:unnamed protein product [Danaus chrysippus]